MAVGKRPSKTEVQIEAARRALEKADALDAAGAGELAGAPEIDAYRAAARALAAAPWASAGPALLETLLARDALAQRLAAPPPLPAAQLAQVPPLDASVRPYALLLVDGPFAVDYAAWRDALADGADRWWWQLDRESAARHQFWSILARLAVLAAVLLMLDLALRFWGDVSIFFTLLSALLALAAVAPLTGWGRRQINRLLPVRRFTPDRRRRILAAGALAMLAVAIVARAGLPRAAARYANARGICLSGATAGQVTFWTSFSRMPTGARNLPAARESLERALVLDPGLSSAWYNLGGVLLDSNDSEGARAAFLRARLFDEKSSGYANNLAFTLLERDLDATDAARLLEEAIDRQRYAALQAAEGAQADSSPAGGSSWWGDLPQRVACLVPLLPQSSADGLEYKLAKNLGWAYLELGRYDLAVEQVRPLTVANSNEPAAFCILALALEGKGVSDEKTKKETRGAWRSCYTYQSNDPDLPAEWTILAKERGQRP